MFTNYFKMNNRTLFPTLKNALHFLAFLTLMSGFYSPMIAQSNDFYFTNKNGWSMDRHVRTTGDINGDGKDDIIGFGEAGVYVSFSDGTNFSVPQLLLNNLAIGAGAWEVNKHPRMVADVNGDGKDDIVGYGGAGVFVALSQGQTLGQHTIWLNHYFTEANGWNETEHVRTTADVNGDGKADLVGFGGGGVFVAYSDGSKFSEPRMLIENFAIGAGGWSKSLHTRLMGDINNDNLADIIGCGGEVYTSTANGKRFTEIQQHDLSFFTNPNWWNLQRHRRMAADVNGDGTADLVGFTESKIYISLMQNGSFQPQQMSLSEFNYTQGWSPLKYPVLMGDFNGDGKSDIIGFKEDKVYMSCSNGTSFDPARGVVFR